MNIELNTTDTKKVRIVNRLDTSTALEPIDPFFTIAWFEEKESNTYADFQTITPEQAAELITFLSTSLKEAGYALPNQP